MTVNDRNRFRKTYSSFRSEPRVQVAGSGGDVTGPDGTTADNLAAFNGSSGKFIKDSGLSVAVVSGAIASINTPLSGDVTGSISVTAVVGLQSRSLSPTAPITYQQIASPDGATWAPTYSGQPCGSVELTFLTSSGDLDGTAFTVPGSPSGNNRFLLTMVAIRVSTAITGSGSVGLRVGTNAGGLQIVTNQAINSGTTLGTISGGLSLTTLGLAMSSSNGYAALLNSGSIVSFRASTTGSISGGKAKCYVYGAFLP